MVRPIRKRPTIGVLAGWQFYEGDVHGFLDLVLRGIHAAAREQECNLLFACGLGHAIGTNHDCPAWPVASPDTDFVPVGPWNTDGLVVINPLLSLERVRYIRQVRAKGHPVVFVGPGGEGKTVLPDNVSGIRQAIAHLVQHGYHRIAFIAGHQYEADEDSVNRLQAYQAALKEYGLDDDPALIVYGSHNYDGGRRAMKQLLEAGAPFRAVLASNDHSAFGAMSVLQEANLRIPEDVAIVGFDDWPAAAGQEPPLTTIHYPIVDAGRKALALLVESINGQPTGEEPIHIPVNLVVRESCGCLPGGSIAAASFAGLEMAGVARESLTRSMLETVLCEVRFLDSTEIESLCGRLVEAFINGLRESDPGIFQAAFLGILKQMESKEENPNVWYPALSMLEECAPRLSGPPGDSSGQCEAMLDQARRAISASMQKSHAQYISKKSAVADQIGLLTSRLFTAVDEDQIFETLGRFLLAVGMGRANIGFYEAEGEDAFAWTRLYPVYNPDPAPVRFPGRAFPPEGLYPTDRPFSLALFPLLDQGQQVEGFVAFDSLDLGTCVTLVRQLTAAFRSVRLYREAIQGRKLAEEADLIKSRFLSTVSHELRTPLNLIVGLSNLVLQDETPGTPGARRQDLEQIHTNAEHLGRLIRDVLDLATSQAGQLRLQLEQLDLVEALGAALEAGEELARQKGLEWQVSLPEGRPLVRGDSTRLSQVLLNLVSNAVKFTESGRIEVKVEAHAEEALVSVRDTGLGIPLEEQDIIFDEFRQSERTATRGYGGMGLGLAITRRLVELHGGKIWVQSSGREGDGSTFSFTLPVIQSQKIVITSPEAGGFVALLVEGSSDQGAQFENRLSVQGFRVKAFRVDQPGWMVRLLKDPPGAAILEAGLAPTRGWEIVRLLKNNPGTQDVPVLFYSLAQDGGSLLELDYLTKPVGPGDLAHALARQGLEAGSDGAGKIILIADDEPGILEMHARIVQAQLPDCRVLQARNGREALALVRHTPPDLILLDLMMPELDGFGVLEALRGDENTRNIPVIVLTGQALTGEDMARLNQGVAAVLQKGIFDAGETLSHVEAALMRTPRLGSEMQRIVRKAMVYIHGNYAETISRKDLASHVGVSGQYLTRCFRQELGVTPIEYLNRYRLKQAKMMLEAGKSVTDTAMAAGFSRASYFTTYFHNEVGISPSAYRRERAKK